MTKYNPNAAPATHPRNPTHNATNKSSLTIQGLDLTGLDEAIGMLEASDAHAQLIGKPLTLSLDKVIEDPDQPRKQFDSETLQTLADSIAIHGIQSPISVRSPDKQGNYRINFGARRRRAAIAAGLTEIPAFIDDDHDRYAQVVENIQRDDFAPMEIADFVGSELAKGEKAANIAKRLGHHKSWVSRYNALNDLPEDIKVRATAGDIPDYNTLYEMGAAAKKDPEQGATFIGSTTGHISRGAFKEFQQLIVSSDNASAASQSQVTASSRSTVTHYTAKTSRAARLEQAESIVIDKPGEQQTSPLGTSNPSVIGNEPKIVNRTYSITEPVVVVSMKGREGVMRLDITGPTGFGFVKFAGEDDSTFVSLGEVKIVRLTERN